jgi:hypothetical protein
MKNVFESQERWQKVIDGLEITVRGESRSISDFLEFLKIQAKNKRIECIFVYSSCRKRQLKRFFLHVLIGCLILKGQLIHQSLMDLSKGFIRNLVLYTGYAKLRFEFLNS